MQEDLFPIPRFVVGVLEQAGVDLDDVLRRCDGPSMRQAGSNRIRLRTDRYFAFWRALEAAGVSPDFGLRLTEAPVLYGMDVASTAALMSENFGEALAALARYKRLTCPEEIDVEVGRHETQVGLRWLHASEVAPPILIDATLAWMCRLASLGSAGLVRPIRIELTRAESRSRSLGEFFGCPVRFNAARDVLVFSGEALQTPFASHHPEMLALMTPGLDAALQARSTTDSSAQQVRNLLVKSMGGKRPSVDRVASELRVSARTLQRRLEDEGTSYQKLLDEVRQQTARQLLAATDLDAGEIAFVLGFEELNSFSRAFQGWEGTSPGRWRMQHTGHRNSTDLVQ
jgi:AraC-like DNA-binding protein